MTCYPLIEIFCLVLAFTAVSSCDDDGGSDDGSGSDAGRGTDTGSGGDSDSDADWDRDSESELDSETESGSGTGTDEADFTGSCRGLSTTEGVCIDIVAVPETQAESYCGVLEGEFSKEHCPEHNAVGSCVFPGKSAGEAMIWYYYSPTYGIGTLDPVAQDCEANGGHWTFF